MYFLINRQIHIFINELIRNESWFCLCFVKMAESDGEYEEEDTLVMVELHGVIDSEIFAQDSFAKFKILAVDSERPILQVENFVFSGEYEHTMGTAVFFEEEDKRVKKCDPVFCKKPSRMLKYVCKTNKKLTMKRVFISEKQPGDPQSTQAEEHSEHAEPSEAGSSSSLSDTSLTTDPEESHTNQDSLEGDPLALSEPCDEDQTDPLSVSSGTEDAVNTATNKDYV